MTDDEAEDQLTRQREQLPRKPQKQPVYLLAAQSRSYPDRPGGRIEQRVLHHQVNTIDKDVLEVRRQRDIFVKLPASSFQGLGKSTSRNESLLTQLMNPDPEVVPAYNQPRHEFRSNEIRVGSRVNIAPIKPVMPATTTQSALAIDKGNAEGKKPSHRFNASHPDLQRNKSVTATPLSLPVLAGRVSIKAPPSIDLSSTMPIDVHGLSEEEAELEIQVSKSAVQDKLKVLTRQQGIVPNIRNADANPAISHASHGDDDNVPQWAKISLPPQHLSTSNRSQGQTQNRRLRKDLRFVELGYERLSNNQTAISIPLDYPYDLPITAPPSTPRTTRRLMLSTELPESLRRNLLWERQVNKVNSTSLKRSGSGGGSNYSVLADHKSLTASPSIAQLDANGTDMPDNFKNDDAESRRTAGGLGEQDRLERGEKKGKVATRSKSWVNDYHYSGW
ncbi:hypothetical protein CPB84DRAFT_1777530 [Gymnopilus junonius]|uniref:DUF3295 domain-containing protein n=1 Tax=Gymnopilus junonius TaxID=109634 RepID=A0A9P5TMR2_GYMJU|nr:hypothetical protein CPB84DRAFT_1777530 [Gymnopilus junonius]